MYMNYVASIHVTYVMILIVIIGEFDLNNVMQFLPSHSFTWISLLRQVTGPLDNDSQPQTTKVLMIIEVLAVAVN